MKLFLLYRFFNMD
uniref:Uncharacterized protein n=1 Tax=Arundo donax TaxID=35708 RepID=A0A0A9GSX9_ARUDO